MQTGSLPARSEVVNSGAIASAKTLRLACISVYNEGDVDTSIARYSVNRGITNINIISTSSKPVIAIRLKAANVRGTIIPSGFTLLSTSNTDIFWELVLNPTTLTTPVWVSAGNDEITEYDVSSTAQSGGTVIDSGYISKQSNVVPSVSQTALRIVADFDGVRDILMLRARTLTSNANMLASMSFEELY
jgi:hypothetical protein